MDKPTSLFWSLIAPTACVLIIATGQILFKTAATYIDFRRPLAEPKGLMVLAVALAIYGFATILWVAVLKQAPLSRIYPIMALSFVIVPLGSRYILKETIAPGYWAGVVLIIIGLIVINRTPSG